MSNKISECDKELPKGGKVNGPNLPQHMWQPWLRTTVKSLSVSQIQAD